MENQYSESLLALIRSGIQGKPLTAEELAAISAAQLPKLGALAKKNDLEHLLALGLRHNGLTSAETAALEKSILVAAFRCRRQQDVLDRVCGTLEEARIPHLPLKGAVLRQEYPEPWMRTSCDVDVLVPQTCVEQAASLLESRCGYRKEQGESHDISLFAPDGTHLELHFTLMEKGLVQNAAPILETVWERAALCDGSSYRYQMPDDLFYCYHIAHMAKHFAIGGGGIRPFLDLWILNRRKDADRQKRDALLEQAGLLKFARTAQALSDAWFAGGPMEPLTAQMQTYILQGGLYNDTENRIGFQQQKQGGRLRYLLARVFLPFDILKYRYPVLQKHPWLMPVMQLRRWFTLIFCGQLGRISREITYEGQISAREKAETRKFLDAIGLL